MDTLTTYHPSRDRWNPDERQQWYLGMVDQVSKRSGDSTKVGFVLAAQDNVLLTVGWNDFPRKIQDLEYRRQRPLKYKWTEHAERNAIYNAARHGIATNNSTGYMRWFPCCDCARCLIQAGVKTLYCGEPNWDDTTWGEDFKISYMMFQEVGLMVRFCPPPKPTVVVIDTLARP